MGDPSPVSFAEKVYALSKVVHIVKFRNDAAATHDDHQRKHLRLLDDIALLLVTGSSSDAAAVSFERRCDEVVFHYAKNRPSTAAEHAHIDVLIATVQAGGTPNDRIRDMLAKVLDICRPKIISRLRKLQSVISKTPASVWYIHEDPEDEVHQYFKQRLGDWYDTCLSASQFLHGFMSNLNSLSVKDCSPSELSLLIELAHITGSFKPSTAIFPDPELAKRVRLLGDYFGAVTRIVKYFDSIRPHPPVPVKITFFEVGFNLLLRTSPSSHTSSLTKSQAAVPQPHQLTFPADFLLILNQCATEKRLPQVDYPALTKAYPSQSPFAVDMKSVQPVTQSVHAECSLAVYLTTLDRTWEQIEIGCSKGSCWLCEMYLNQYCSILKFYFSNLHGKLQPGWTIPVGGDPVSRQRILDLVDDAVLEVLHRTNNSKRSDSEPRSGSESDEKKKVAAERAAKPGWFMA